MPTAGNGRDVDLVIQVSRPHDRGLIVHFPGHWASPSDGRRTTVADFQFALT